MTHHLTSILAVLPLSDLVVLIAILGLIILAFKLLGEISALSARKTRLNRNCVKTTAKVVGRIKAETSRNENQIGRGNYEYKKGHFLWLEFHTVDGEQFKIKTKDIIEQSEMGGDIELWYYKDKPSDFVLNPTGVSWEAQIQQKRKQFMLYGALLLSCVIYFIITQK